LKVNKISSKEKMENTEPATRSNRDRLFERFLKVRKRPFYNRNRAIKKKTPSATTRPYRRLKRRWHRRVHPGWQKFLEEHPVSADLQAVIGRPKASWGQIVSLIWTYIRENKLQKQGNGRIFVPDQALARVVGNEGQELDGFKMMAYLNAHIL
jgi:chromatin remodeling complex protein RSC6